MGRTRRPVRYVFSALVLAGGVALVACHPVKIAGFTPRDP